VNRLKQIRERKSLTLAQLSARTSIPLRLLNDYEANAVEIPPPHLKSLSKALWVKPEELVPPPGAAPLPPFPAAPAPPPLPAPPVEPVTAGPAPPAPALAEAPAPTAPLTGGLPAPRPYVPAAPYGAPRPPRPNGPPPGPDGGRGARPPARSRREPVVMPATDGQITEIMRLAARLNLSTEEIERQFGRPMDNITRFDAREWIKKLREDAIAKAPPAKVHFGQWPGLKEDREAVYLTEQRDAQAHLRVTLFNGQVFSGRIVDFTPYTITLDESAGDSGEQIVLRKLAIAYYQRVDNGNGQSAATQAGAQAKEIAPLPGSGAPQFQAPEDATQAAAPPATDNGATPPAGDEESAS